jgi:hypothetical protein
MGALLNPSPDPVPGIYLSKNFIPFTTKRKINFMFKKATERKNFS